MYFLTYADIADTSRTVVVIALSSAVPLSFGAIDVRRRLWMLRRNHNCVTQCVQLRSEIARYRSDHCSQLLCSRRARKQYREMCTLLILATREGTAAASLDALYTYEEELLSAYRREQCGRCAKHHLLDECLAPLLHSKPSSSRYPPR